MKSLQVFDFSYILGWSISRYDTFKFCKRQYYYQYYGKYDEEFPVSKINLLKNLTSVPLEVGNVVHDVNKTLLERLKKNVNAINKTKFFDFTQRKIEKYCQEKQFYEIYYKQVENIDPDFIFKQVKTCLLNLLESDRFKWLTDEATKFAYDWIIEPPGYGETRINDLKAYCKVDFLFPINEKMYIVDWKTGKPDVEKHRKQLLGYATWASFHFEMDPENIISIVSYLMPEYNETQMPFNEWDVEEFASQVKEETEEMYHYCKDVEKNIPIEKEKFTKTPHQKLCQYCNYYELCFYDKMPKKLK